MACFETIIRIVFILSDQMRRETAWWLSKFNIIGTWLVQAIFPRSGLHTLPYHGTQYQRLELLRFPLAFWAMRHEYCSSELKLVNLLTDKDGAKMLLQQDGVMVKQHCTVSHWNSQYGRLCHFSLCLFLCVCRLRHVPGVWAVRSMSDGDYPLYFPSSGSMQGLSLMESRWLD